MPALAAENIDSRKYYDPPIHKQTAYRPFYHGEPLPNTDWLSDNSLSLPMWSHMSDEIAHERLPVHSLHPRKRCIHPSKAVYTNETVKRLGQKSLYLPGDRPGGCRHASWSTWP